MARLDDRIDQVFDPRTAKILASSLDVHTVGELLRHYPRRYEQRGELTDLANLRDGEHVTVLAQIKAVTTRAMRNRRGNACRRGSCLPRQLPAAGPGHQYNPLVTPARTARSVSGLPAPSCAGAPRFTMVSCFASHSIATSLRST